MKKKDFSTEDLRRMDLAYLWHPYTDIDVFEKTSFPIVSKAKGCWIYDHDGKKYLDGIASWWCVNFGHSHPKLIKTIKEQAEKLQNVILGGMSHENAILLAKKLVEISPAGLNHCFFASDGSSAVEAALRMTLQYWQNVGEQNKKKFIALQDGYHGDTLGAIGVGYVDLFHKELRGVANENYRAMSPHCAKCPFQKHPKDCDVECFSSMKNLIEKKHKEVAAVIVEPLCQGAAGVRIYPEQYLQKLRKLCDEYDLFLIADEIAVGFARTGAMFACEKAKIVPDLMTLGKGLTGGYLPMSAVVASSRIFDSFRGGKNFYHGHTFCGNPITSAVALKSLELYSEENILQNVAFLEKIMEQRMKILASFFQNSFFQCKGMIAMVEIHQYDGGVVKAKKIAAKALQLGLLLRPLGSTLYLWPPLIMTEKDLNKMFDLFEQAIKECI